MHDTGFNRKQLAYEQLVTGTLVYGIVLGFFDDYTGIVTARSFSTIFFASIVLSILTWLTLLLKKRVLARLRGREGGSHPLLIVFCLWLILFLSKFVFLGAIDLLFGNDIDINGFFGILWVVLSVTIIMRLDDFIFDRLGDPAPPE